MLRDSGSGKGLSRICRTLSQISFCEASILSLGTWVWVLTGGRSVTTVLEIVTSAVDLWQLFYWFWHTPDLQSICDNGSIDSHIWSRSVFTWIERQESICDNSSTDSHIGSPTVATRFFFPLNHSFNVCQQLYRFLHLESLWDDSIHLRIEWITQCSVTQSCASPLIHRVRWVYDLTSFYKLTAEQGKHALVFLCDYQFARGG